MKLEVVVIPVSDVDAVAGDIRLIRFRPAGSGCSVQFGRNLTPAEAGSARALHLIVSDIEVARDDLVKRWVKANEVFHCSSGFVCRFHDAGAPDRVGGRSPEQTSYGSFASFSDPDGNSWLLQEVTTRFPGRMDPAATPFASTGDVAAAL